MKQAAFATGLAAVTAFILGCGGSDFPTTPSPVALTPLTTLSALKVNGNASLPGGELTPISMTLIARSVSITAPGAQAQAPGTTEMSGNFELGTGVKGTVTGTVEGSLESGTLRGRLQSSGEGCAREYVGPVSTAGFGWLTSDSSGTCPLPITVQAARADAPAACTYTVPPLGAIPGSGTTTVLNITTGPTCTWVVQAMAPWLRVSGPSTGVGSATVTLVVDPSEAARQGTVLVAGQPVTITQSQTCTVTVAPTVMALPDGGGSRTITVTAPSGCEWRVEGAPAWVTVSPSSGNGTSTLTIVAQPNTAAQREGSLQIAGQSVALTQAGRPGGPAPCIQGVVVGAASFAATGGSGSIDITAGETCQWTAASDVPWITVTPSSGTGAGRATFTVQPNTGPQRTGTILVAGRVLTISQAAAQETPACTYQLTVVPNPLPATGGTALVSIATQEQCEWSVQSTVDWITVPAGTGRGTGSIQVIASANPSGTVRQGELRIAGQTAIVTQQPSFAAVTVTLNSSPKCSNSDGESCFARDFGGGSVTGPAGFSCSIAELRNDSSSFPGSRQQVCTGSFAVGASVTFTAAPGPDSDFSGWGGACTGPGPTCTFNVAAAGSTVDATFIPEPVLQLFVDSGDTTVTSNPAGIDCRDGATCRTQFDTGVEVILDAGSDIALWIGCDTPALNVESRTCRVRMTGDRFVTVYFGGILTIGTRKVMNGISSEPQGQPRAGVGSQPAAKPKTPRPNGPSDRR